MTVTNCPLPVSHTYSDSTRRVVITSPLCSTTSLISKMARDTWNHETLRCLVTSIQNRRTGETTIPYELATHHSSRSRTNWITHHYPRAIGTMPWKLSSTCSGKRRKSGACLYSNHCLITTPCRLITISLMKSCQNSVRTTDMRTLVRSSDRRRRR